MADKDLRVAERAAQADQDDFEAFQRWRAAAARAGAPAPGAEELVAEMEVVERRWHAVNPRAHELSLVRGDRAKRLRIIALQESGHCFRRFKKLFRAWLRVTGRRSEWDAHFYGPIERFSQNRRVLETSLLFAPSRDVIMLMQHYVPGAIGRRRRRQERMAALGRPADPALRPHAPPVVTSGST